MSENELFYEGRKLSVTCSNPTSPTSGDPVRWGLRTGVAIADELTDGTTSVDFGGVYDLSVKGTNDQGSSAVAVGDALYYVDADTPKVSKKAAGYFMGYALEAVNSGATATIGVVLADSGPAGTIELPAEGITLAAIEDLASARLIVGNASARPTAVDVTGDVTISNAGVTAIGANKVLTEMILNGEVTAAKLDPAIDIATTGGIRSAGTTAGDGLGMATGAGGAVTQITSRSTGVELSKLCGTITTDTSSLAGLASADFVVTNTLVAATDTVIVSIQSGSDSGGAIVSVAIVAAGSFTIRVSNNNAAASTAETGAIKINFVVIKSVAA